MKTREEIITSMCFTYRHDYGLVIDELDQIESPLISGVTRLEQQRLWNQMAQIFDNDIAPYMQFKE